MKPVIKKQHIYSVLLMRDDSTVKRFRIRAVWIKIVAWLALLLCLAAVAGGWGTYHYWKKYSLLQGEFRLAEQEVRESRPKLERLANLEKILQTDAALTPAVMSGVEAEAAAPKGAPMPQGMRGATANGRNATNQTLPATNQPLAAANQTMPPANPAMAAANQTQTASPAAQEASDSVDASGHPAKIANMSLRASGTNRIRISFDLMNQNPQQTLNGRANLAVVKKNGDVHEVTNVERDDLRFLISRYKKIITNFSLPADVAASDVGAVQVSIDSDGFAPLVERFPMP